MIGRELVGMAAEHVARELVEQDHGGERGQRIVEEGLDRQLALLGPQLEEALRIRWSSSGSPFHHCFELEPEPEFEDVGAPVARHVAQAGGAADGQAVDQQGRLADAGGHGLAALAADADAFVEREVVADALDPGQHGRAVADQGRALDRLGDLAAADAIGLGAGEDELAAGDVDLPAAEALGVDAVLDPLDQLGRIVLAGRA